MGCTLWCSTPFSDFRLHLRHNYTCLRCLGRCRLCIHVRSELPERLAHSSDMLRSGAAASTEQSHSSVQEPVGVFGKILGSRHIHKSIPDPFGKASIWLSSKKLSIREPATHGFNDFQ